MPTLLHLDSSADVVRSRTRAIGRAFVAAWQEGGPDHTVVYRDLHREPLPHIPDASLHWPPVLRSADANPPAAAEALQRELVDELLAADVLLVGAPLYNYSLPSSLKAWVDYIHLPTVTTGSADAPGPMAGRPAVVISAKGGRYDEGEPSYGQDHGLPVLELILGAALGMTVTAISTTATLADHLPALAEYIPRSEAELAAAIDLAQRTARDLSAPCA